MKKILLPISALFIGFSANSCDSCNKKHDADSTATTYTDTAAVQANADTSDVANASDMATPNTSASGTSGHAKINSSSKSATKTDDKSMKGYSAPDGTDAENHDGDQYTKNDATPKPTGPPIK
jgi:hypothetical protein